VFHTLLWFFLDVFHPLMQTDISISISRHWRTRRCLFQPP